MGIASMTSQHSVGHYARTRTTGVAGGAAFTRATAATATLCCRVQPATAYEQAESMQRGYEISHTLWFGKNPGVSRGDWLLFGARWLVAQAPAVNIGELGRLWRLDCMETEMEQD